MLILDQPTPAAAKLWVELARLFRDACNLRRQGRHSASTVILEKKLPALIRAWTIESRLPAAAAKSRLQQLFSNEQARIESSQLIARLAPTPVVAAPPAATTTLTLEPAPAGAVGRAHAWYPPISPRRIPIDDVVGMLDMVRDQELRETLAHASAA